MKCINLKIRTKKGIKYAYCTLKREEVPLFCKIDCFMINYTKKVKQAKKGHKNKLESVSNETYNEVYSRDKGQCRLCGTTEQLQLHHIHGRGKDKTNNIDNCIMLCMNCHLYVVHKNLKKYRPILDDLVKNLQN